MNYLRKIAQAEAETVGIKPIRILKFPYVRQATNYSCGCASIQAVLYYYGIDIREDNLIKIFKDKSIVKSGIDPDVMKEALEKEWHLTVDMRKMSIDEVKDCIDRDIPVILLIQAWRGEDKATDEVDYSKDYKDGHYVVAIGYSDRHMIFEDPSILSNRGYLLFEDLESRWHGISHGNKVEHLGLVINGKTPVYNPDSFKKIW